MKSNFDVNFRSLNLGNLHSLNIRTCWKTICKSLTTTKKADGKISKLKVCVEANNVRVGLCYRCTLLLYDYYYSRRLVFCCSFSFPRMNFLFITLEILLFAFYRISHSTYLASKHHWGSGGRKSGHIIFVIRQLKSQSTEEKWREKRNQRHKSQHNILPVLKLKV